MVQYPHRESDVQAAATALPFNLERFLTAQASIYEQARAEISAGEKRSHWMWFIFPQLRGLGYSPTAQHFGIARLEEAVAYLRHEVLGARLRECTALMIAIMGKYASEILGYPDDLKFRSSITLFAEAAKAVPPDSANQVFEQALVRFFQGQPDPATLSRL